MLVIGYPSESRSVNYEKFEVSYKRILLHAEYKGKSIEENCHKLKILESVDVDDYDGLSGAPVFYLKEIPHEGSIAIVPLFTGMLLRGSSKNKTAHFVSSNVLINLINKAENENP